MPTRMTETRRSYPNNPEVVYLYGTCLVDMCFPEAGMAAIRLLQREGLRVVYPEGQGCCGQPAYNAGFQEEARAVARSQIPLFPKDYPIVVPSGSCAGMMKHHYPKLFDGDPYYPEAERFAGRVFELTEFLVHVLGVRLEDKGKPIHVTWHPSCHSTRIMGIEEEPKSLLRQLANVELVRLESEDDCCGFGGVFCVKQPLISSAMVEDKVADVCRTGAECLLSLDCGCLLNIGGALEFKGTPIVVKHIAEFLWERVNA